MTGPFVEYLRMGGYAFYVWCSYAVVLVVLALNLIVPSLRLRRTRRALFRESRCAQAPDRDRDGDDLLDTGDSSGGTGAAGAASRPPAATARRDDP